MPLQIIGIRRGAMGLKSFLRGENFFSGVKSGKLFATFSPLILLKE
jgi:hypothetical protein